MLNIGDTEETEYKETEKNVDGHSDNFYQTSTLSSNWLQ